MSELSVLGDGSTLARAWANARRILCVRLDNIGDIVLLSPALRAIRSALPAAHLTLMASPGGSQAAVLLPWVDEVLTWRAIWQDISRPAGLDPEKEQALFAELRRRNFDAAILFTSFSQSPYPPAYACYCAGIPLRAGHSYEFGGGLLTDWFSPPGREGHQAERNLALLRNLGFAATDPGLELQVPAEAQAEADRLLALNGVAPGEPWIALAPGASCQARRYPAPHFARAARLLVERLGRKVIVLGSANEAQHIRPVLAEAENDRSGQILSLVGQTSVPVFAGLVRRSSLVVANNSSALHFAEAFHIPMVILYSGTELESQWRPRRTPAVLLRRDTACSPCFRFECPYAQECLDIGPAEVAAAAQHLLAQALPSQAGWNVCVFTQKDAHGHRIT